MQTTSHFIGIELKSEIFSDIFCNIYTYLKDNNIENSVSLQNPLSCHITLYYLQEQIPELNKKEILGSLSTINLLSDIHTTGYKYFFRDNIPHILYLGIKTSMNLKNYRDKFHQKYQALGTNNNNLDFIPHITFLRITKPEVFHKHRKNIENIISKHLEKLFGTPIQTGNIYLYAVNSKYKEEIQIPLKKS